MVLHGKSWVGSLICAGLACSERRNQIPNGANQANICSTERHLPVSARQLTPSAKEGVFYLQVTHLS